MLAGQRALVFFGLYGYHVGHASSHFLLIITWAAAKGIEMGKGTNRVYTILYLWSIIPILMGQYRLLEIIPIKYSAAE
jgi:hypothetical protein